MNPESRRRGQFKKGDPKTVEAGRKGGLISKGGAFAKDREFAREMGRKGGIRSSLNREKRCSKCGSLIIVLPFKNKVVKEPYVCNLCEYKPAL